MITKTEFEVWKIGEGSNDLFPYAGPFLARSEAERVLDSRVSSEVKSSLRIVTVNRTIVSEENLNFCSDVLWSL